MSDLVGTCAQVAERLETCEDVVQQLVRDGRIPHVRLGGRKVVIPWAALNDWLLTEAGQNLRTAAEDSAA